MELLDAYMSDIYRGGFRDGYRFAKGWTPRFPCGHEGHPDYQRGYAHGQLQYKHDLRSGSVW